MDRANGCHFGILALGNYGASAVALFHSSIAGTIGTIGTGTLVLLWPQLYCLSGAKRHIGIVLP